MNQWKSKSPAGIPDAAAKTRSFFDEFSRKYDNKIVRSYFSSNHQIIINSLKGRDAARILDTGCGPGGLLSELAMLFPDARLTGVDISENMISMARSSVPNCQLFVDDVESLPFGDGEFDLVVNCVSFHHYPRPNIAIAELCRVLAPGGALFLLDSTRDPWWLSYMTYYWDWIDGKKCYSRHLSQREYSELFRAGGVSSVVISRTFKLPGALYVLFKCEKSH